MAETTHPSGTGAHAAPGGEGTSRRDFLYLATGAVGAVGVAAAAWPFIDSMNPAADTLALASIEVDLSPIQEGQAITVTWRGKPVFIRYRTEREIAEATQVNIRELPDPQADDARVQRAQWLVVIGVCTHLGCVPLGQKPTDPRGDFDGWFCPCHGSHYDTSGRIRRGPAPANLVVPEYAFISDTAVKLG
ncbi:ubiquinol-cytochrome c reductase iron-sulfur subunit [Azospirillum halopraeferens]|uniref:ubiquinol-cytochrome c reductase iron-sulfur subunit n=1 Tax=Azospirillum halopraeferens TaxID=34010 RepID=UPI000402C8FE|nr:ubiquinol-cytochrome c reductase iron-sulfur subunit [Azospirillum halopraeferens]